MHPFAEAWKSFAHAYVEAWEFMKEVYKFRGLKPKPVHVEIPPALMNYEHYPALQPQNPRPPIPHPSWPAIRRSEELSWWFINHPESHYRGELILEHRKHQKPAEEAPPNERTPLRPSREPGYSEQEDMKMAYLAAQNWKS